MVYERLYLVASAILVVLGLALHTAFFLTAGPLWRDEAHEVNFASFETLSDVLGHLWLDSSPALYKLFLRAWSHLGEADKSYRLSGLLIAGLHIGVLLAFFGRRWRRAPPVLALALPLLSTDVVRQFDALRPYGLGVLLMTVFFGTFLWFFRAPGARSYWLTAAAGILAVNATYHACFFVLAACLAGALVELLTGHRWRRAAALLSIGVWPLFGALPYLSVVRRSSSWIAVQQSKVPFSNVLDVFRQAAGQTAELAALALLVASLFFLGERLMTQNRTTMLAEAREGMLGLMTMVLFSIFVLGSFYGSDIPPISRHYVPLLMMAALCLDVALRSQPLRWRAGVALTLVLIALAGLPAGLDRVTARQTNVDAVAERIERLAAPQDLVLLRSWSSAISFCRYYDGPAPVWTIPDLADHQIHRFDLLHRKFEEENPIGDVLAAVESTLQGGHRVFLVGQYRPVPPTPRIPQLAPAPHPRYGWYKVPYLWNWQDRVAQFIIGRATHIVEATPQMRQEVSDHERLPLRIAGGWREWAGDEEREGADDASIPVPFPGRSMSLRTTPRCN